MAEPDAPLEYVWPVGRLGDLDNYALNVFELDYMSR